MKRSIFILVAMLFGGCSTPPTPTSAPIATSTPTPLPSATATQTPVPPTPSVPPPDAALHYLLDPVVDRAVWFDSASVPDWDVAAGTIADGVLTITGDGNWNGVMPTRQFVEGQGILLKYRTEGARDWNPFFYNGIGWGQPGYLGLGIYDPGFPVLDFVKGPNVIGAGSLRGNLRPKVDTWYELLMVLGPHARFLAVVYDPADPNRLLKHEEVLGEDWEGHTWNFRINVNKGTLRIDDFQEVSFKDIMR